MAPPSIPFHVFTSLLHEISTVPRKKKGNTRRIDSTRSASHIFQDWVYNLRRVFPVLTPGTTAIVFRLLFPEEDISRKYGMKEATMARCIADVLGLSTRQNGRGRALADWNASDAVGCLGTEVEEIMQSLGQTSCDSTISILEVDALLTELAASCPYSASSVRSAVENPRPKRALMQRMYQSLDAEAAGFLTQIILKDLRPILYPLRATHYTTSLLKFNTKAITMLTKEDAMKIWDPTLKMYRAYRVRATLESAADIYEDPNATLAPQAGTPIAIPKCVKGQGCSHAVKLLRGSQAVWAETKYDGERAQIHVQVDEDMQSNITIFSKSKRDSTLDRFGVHHIIREALCLPQIHQKRGGSQYNPTRIKNIVIEAEMVAYSDSLACVDEFWRIRSLVASTAIGVRHSSPVPDAHTNAVSQCSLVSDASDGGTRHLALVYFDILVLNDESVLHKPYSERRALLETLVHVVPGYSMIAERKHISCLDDADATAEHLSAALARTIAYHQEGLVLKAEESRYGDWKLPWVKLKKDYIPGHGDTVDVVLLGAGWDKSRARELCVAPTVFTTFYLGVLANASEVLVQNDAVPHFVCSFTASYGLTREQLEELNFMIRASDPVSSSMNPVQLPYRHTLYPGLPTPTVFLPRPLLVEIFGAGFTKPPGCQFYELRFPRITKVFRQSERSWRDGVTLQEFQKLARDVIGLDRPGKNEEDWCKSLWGMLSSPSVKSAVKRKQRTEEWFEKLERADGRSPTRRRLLHAEEQDVENRDNHTVERIPAKIAVAPRSQVMTSVTNVTSTPPPAVDMPQFQSSTPSITRSPALPPGDLEQHPLSTPSGQQPSVGTRTPPISPPAHDARAIPLALATFLEDTVVWFGRPSDTKRPIGRAASRLVASQGQQVHTLESFLAVCGWGPSTAPSCAWLEKGVVFVDDSSEQWLTYPMVQLLARRSSLLREKASDGVLKPVHILSMRSLNSQTWETAGDRFRIEDYCLTTLG